MRKGDGDGRNLALRRHHRPILPVKAQVHCKCDSLTDLEHNKFKRGVLETHAMIIIDQDAVKDAVWNLWSKAVKQI
jgi:hypothetical protein